MRKTNWKKEIRDWRNWVWIGMSSFGTFIALISWLSSPQGQQVIQHLGHLV
jgi:hypothetical protein